MSMTIYTNNASGVPYTQYGTDKQKQRAAKFVNKNDLEISQIAYNINGQANKDKKFAKTMSGVFKLLPVIGGVAAGIAAKGKLSTKSLAGIKAAAITTVGLAIPMAVINVNNAIANKSSKLDKAEKKHPILTFAGLLAVASFAIDGAVALGRKISPKANASIKTIAKKVKLDKLAAKLDKAPEAVQGLAKKVASKITLPNAVKDKLSTLSSKIKMPQILNDGYKKVAEAPITKNIVAKTKNLGKTILKYPVTATLAGMIVATVAHAVKRNKNMNETKADLKAAQQNTAIDLINAYSKENESLKIANAKSAKGVDDANKILDENE